MKNIGNMMKQAQKLQAKMLKMQEELAEKTVEATAGGGMVRREETPSQNSRSRADRRSGGLPAMIAALTAPMEMPASQEGA